MLNILPRTTRDMGGQRCLQLILLSVLHAVAIDEDELFRARNTTMDTPLFFSDFGSTPSVHGVKCTYELHRPLDYVWRCTGDKLFVVPSNLTSSSNSMALMINGAAMEILSEDSLTPYAGFLKGLYLISLPEFRTIEPGTFKNASQLRTIYINSAPSLTHIHEDVFKVHLPRLKIIRILRTALLSLPYLGELVTDDILHTVDFENNQIRRIRTAWVRIKSVELLLNYNKISTVDSMAFNGSQIAKLSFKGNTALTSIHTDAFVGLSSIQHLDLSNTSITSLPTKGLQELDKLTIENTITLKSFPSVYKFNSITEAHLTYPYHCCAFKFPAKHDPEMHKRHEELMAKMKKDCARLRRRRRRESSSYQSVDSYSSINYGVFHNIVVTPASNLNIFCGPVNIAYQNVTCRPEPDAFNPCEDIMGYLGLRIAVWLVAILAIVGNLAVLIVLISMRLDMSVPKFLMCNLAFADLCMGIYLTLIAGMDAHTIGEYFNYAIDWQNGLGCQVAGFLTVFSTELSIFTLMIITCERWYTITYAIYLNRRLNLKTCSKIMALGWIYASIMAALPLLDVSGYQKTSICLPLAMRNTGDLLYLVTLLIFTGLAFLVIVACYGRIYFSIRKGREEVTPVARSDMTVAKRMSLLIFTDFVCWAPVAFFGITALAGQPLIDVTKTKILLVFVYPLNSCANPYLYALLTDQYRRDLLKLLARYGICKDTAAKYRSGAEAVHCTIRRKTASPVLNETDNVCRKSQTVGNDSNRQCETEEFRVELHCVGKSDGEEEARCSTTAN